MGWDTSDKNRQECTRQQPDKVHHQGFKLDLLGEGDVLLRNREESGNTVTLGSGENLRSVQKVFGRAPPRK